MRSHISIFGSGGDYLPVSGGGPDVAFDAAASSNANSDTTIVQALTVGTLTNGAIVAFVAFVDGQAGAASFSGVSSSVNGAFTAVSGSSLIYNSAANSVDVGIAGYILLNPTAGAHNITATYSEDTDAMLIGVYSFANVHQSASTGTPVTSDQSGNDSYTQTITSAAGDMVVGAMIAQAAGLASSNITAGTQAFETYEAGFWGSSLIGAYRAAAGATTDIGYTMREQYSGASGFALKKA